jgi:glycosyltransferase involved in cell wall biosynthesis
LDDVAMLLGRSIAVVVPAYNEARLIRSTLESIPTFVDYVIVVDDASVDETGAIARGCDRVQLIEHHINRGVGAAIATGCKRALLIGAEITAVMAADAQMDPSDLPALLAPLALGEADYVKGNRLQWPSARQAMPWHRWAGNHVLSSLTRKAVGLDVGDSQCGYAALSRAAKQAIDWDRLWPGYGYPNDLLSRLIMQGLRIREVPVRPVYGQAQSGIRVRHVASIVFFVIVRAWFRRLRAARSRVALTSRTWLR